MPDQWEDTTGMKRSNGWQGKDITSGLPFLFYWVDDEIKIIKHRDDIIPCMKSDKDWLIVFDSGLAIQADQNAWS